MAATTAAADGALALNNRAKQTTLLLFCGQGNARKNGLLSALSGASL
jgi:hypothetical protein